MRSPLVPDYLSRTVGLTHTQLKTLCTSSFKSHAQKGLRWHVERKRKREREREKSYGDALLTITVRTSSPTTPSPHLWSKPSTPHDTKRENATAPSVSTDSMGNRDETQDGLYAHMIQEKRETLSKTTEILIKEKQIFLLPILIKRKY